MLAGWQVDMNVPAFQGKVKNKVDGSFNSQLSMELFFLSNIKLSISACLATGDETWGISFVAETCRF